MRTRSRRRMLCAGSVNRRGRAGSAGRPPEARGSVAAVEAVEGVDSEVQAFYRCVEARCAHDNKLLPSGSPSSARLRRGSMWKLSTGNALGITSTRCPRMSELSDAMSLQPPAHCHEVYVAPAVCFYLAAPGASRYSRGCGCCSVPGSIRSRGAGVARACARRGGTRL